MSPPRRTIAADALPHPALRIYVVAIVAAPALFLIAFATGLGDPEDAPSGDIDDDAAGSSSIQPIR
jgi:hypothetical protein